MYDISKTMYFKVLFKAAPRSGCTSGCTLIYISIINSTGTVNVQLGQAGVRACNNSVMTDYDNKFATLFFFGGVYLQVCIWGRE